MGWDAVDPTDTPRVVGLAAIVAGLRASGLVRVVDNVRRCRSLSRHVCLEVLDAAIVEHRARGDAVDALNTACRAHRLRGRTASLPAGPSTELHHVVPEHKFHEELWRTIRRNPGIVPRLGVTLSLTQVESWFHRWATPAERRSVLSLYQMHEPGEAVFATLDPSGTGDPLTGCTKQRIVQRLGLRASTYSAGGRMFRVTYPASSATHCRVPSFADAGAHEHWHPVGRAEPTGLTWDPSRGCTDLPEVVHEPIPYAAHLSGSGLPDAFA